MAKWLLPGCFFRFGGYFSLLFYIPIAFAKIYPENINEFSTINAFIDIVLANGSALLGGYLSDKLEKDTYWIKPGLTMGASLISGPLICAGLLKQDDFYFSISLLALHFLFSQSFEAPALTMFQNTSPLKIQGFTISIWNLVATFGGIIFTTILGVL